MTDKYTGKVAFRVAQAESAFIDAGIEAAVEATEPMARMASYERQAALQHCVDRFTARFDELDVGGHLARRGKSEQQALSRGSIWAVAILSSFTDFDEALAEVNDSKFGLQAGVVTRDLFKALDVWERLDVGGVTINDVPSYCVDNILMAASRSPVSAARG